jgi:ArsR family transcriptional regulator, arsenate/arsenite/antimonite-responsive transcriptional repressor / arsenate reductase (thioredoxin)
MAEKRTRFLFLCTHNKARSQIAEGICRHLGGDKVEVESAGSEPSVIHPLAIKALSAMGIDASGQRSKHLDEIAGRTFDYVITVCDRVREICPVFPGAPTYVHWGLRDPTAVTGSQAMQEEAFNNVARQIDARMRHLLAQLERNEPQ